MALWAVAWADVCLLTLRARLEEVPSSEWTARRESLSAWLTEHRKLRAAVPLGASESDIDLFIQKQQKSSDVCHAKMLEVQRTLDGLHSKVYHLSEAVEANEVIVSAHTTIIEERAKQKEAKKEGAKIALAACDSKRELEKGEGAKLQKELDELDAVAKSASGSAVPATASFAERVSSLSKLDCSRVVATLEAVNSSKTYRQMDCNGRLELLQREFANSYLSIWKLKEQEEKNVASRHDQCVNRANNQDDEASQLLDDSATRSTLLINEALDRVAGINPQLGDAKRSLLKVDTHLKSLKDSCKVEGDVTQHLARLRSLIESLEKCPGRHDFTLTKPVAAQPAAPKTA